MSNERRIVHEIKLERSVKIILMMAVFILGLQVFGPALSIKTAMADLSDGDRFQIDLNLRTPDYFKCSGCN